MTRRDFVAGSLAASAFSLSPHRAIGDTGPRAGWRFRFRRFLICAWLGPDGTDAEVAAYRNCGFSAVMVGRYMTAGDYCQPEEVARHFRLAERHGLAAFLDTYTKNHLPWGGIPGPYDGKPGHHNATPEEFRWLHERFGNQRSLIGYMLGDDQGSLTPTLLENTAYLKAHAPHLFPWVCGWVPGNVLARGGNPIMDPQMYPTLDNPDPAEKQVQNYAAALQHLRESCRKYDLIPWPMFNVDGVDSDSLIRFQVYSSIAYGAQALWYFTYRDYGALNTGKENQRGCSTGEEVRKRLTPAYYDAREANQRVLSWGPELIGRVASEIYHTGWDAPGQDVWAPGEGRTIVHMSPDLLAGILTKPGAPPVAIVVDKRVSKKRGELAPRPVEIRFGRGIAASGLRGLPTDVRIERSRALLTLPAGGGALLRLSEG